MKRMNAHKRQKSSDGNHVYHFAVFALLVFMLTLLGTIGLTITGEATGYQAGAYTLDSFRMIALMFILSLAFLVPVDIMIRKSRTLNVSGA